MFGRAYKLFEVFGFSIKVDLSWFIIALLLSWSLAEGVFGNPELFPQWEAHPGLRWAMGIAGTLGLFTSVVLHELGHALAARRYGIPMRGITLFIFGGVAEMTDEPPTAKSEFVMAIAGPLVSIALAGIFWGLALLPWPASVRAVLGWLGFINLVLVVFNMIPAFPLDGGRVLRSALWAWKKRLRWATRITSALGSLFGWLLIMLGVATFIMGNFIGGAWWFLIGMFLRNAARMSYQQLLIRRALEGEPVRRFMHPHPRWVPPDLTLDRLVEDYVYRYHHKMFPVMQDGRLVGCISTQQIRQVPHERWATETVGHVAGQCSQDNTVSPDADAMQALTKMNRTGRSRLMVVDPQGHLAGVITLKDLMRFLSLKVELENGGGSRAHPAMGG